MLKPYPVIFALFLALCSSATPAPPASQPPLPRGRAIASSSRPEHFPHRIWAASDFESPLPDYAWFGRPKTAGIPDYPGNVTALASIPDPSRHAAVFAGMNPVPGPRMGKVNHLYCRYLLKGASEAIFQHFSLTREDNNHIRVSGLDQDRWSQVTLNFTRDAIRNDGSPQAFAEGERMDDLKVYVGKSGQQPAPQFLLDDVIFFATDPSLAPDPEPFPNRIIYLAAFDTGIEPLSSPHPSRGRYKYYPGDLEIHSKDLPANSYWGIAKAIPRKDGRGQMLRLMIDPPKPVGARTKLRFRYHITGASAMTVQIFDATDQDNRHINLKDLKQGEWTFTYVDFTKDGRKNDGNQTPFAAGHKVDDLFFFVDGKDVRLLIDEVTLFDSGENR